MSEIKTITVGGVTYDLPEGVPTFIGTISEWESLTTAEKAEFDGGIVNITNDYEDETIIDDTTTASDKVWSSQKVSQSISNPNLLDNPWFAVNQRGESSYSIANNVDTYTIDRWVTWKGSTGSFVIEPCSKGYGIETTVSLDAEENAFRQRIINKNLLGKKVTLSIDLDGEIFSATDILPSTQTSSWQLDYCGMLLKENIYLCVNIAPNSQNFLEEVIIRPPKNGNSHTINAIKLEVGSISTLHLDTIPNYATELLKCQRYFQRFKFAQYQTIALLFASPQWSTFLIPSQKMRVTPVVTTNGTINSANIAGEDVSATYNTVTPSAGGYFVGGARLVSGNNTSGYIYFGNSEGGYVDLSADL